LSEARSLLDVPGGRTALAAYDWCLKASHAFNVLDARGAISVSQRAGMILAIRKLACAVAARYVGGDDVAERDVENPAGTAPANG
jgi:glycyl-tRNA synthetase alpha chain